VHINVGHCAPYGAVLSLTLMAAHNWRALRYKLQTYGIADPMALPSLHSVLDHMEVLALESFQSDNPQRDKVDRDQFVTRLYRPDPPLTATAAVKGVKALPPPPPDGFDAAETRKSFAAFARAL